MSIGAGKAAQEERDGVPTTIVLNSVTAKGASDMTHAISSSVRPRDQLRLGFSAGFSSWRSSIISWYVPNRWWWLRKDSIVIIYNVPLSRLLKAKDRGEVKADDVHRHLPEGRKLLRRRLEPVNNLLAQISTRFDSPRLLGTQILTVSLPSESLVRCSSQWLCVDNGAMILCVGT